MIEASCYARFTMAALSWPPPRLATRFIIMPFIDGGSPAADDDDAIAAAVPFAIDIFFASQQLQTRPVKSTFLV